METSGGVDSHVAALAQPERLRRELARAFRGVARCDAFVAFRSGERVARACVRDSSAAPACTFGAIEIGCVTKLLTATLVRRAFGAGLLAPDAEAARVFCPGAATRALRGITVRQLLDHTHGLDDSQIAAVPRRADRRIDVDALVHALCDAPALAQPGAIYSYGSAGAWLVAALLERVDGRPYAEQVRTGILGPLRIRERSRTRAPICPATGSPFVLDPADLLRFVGHAVLDAAEAWPGDDRAGTFGKVTRLPGWSPLERGVHLGWKYCGRGWFGHQSVWPRASLLVRANPRRALAFVVASREHSAAVVAARVLGAHVPELFELGIPARTGVAPAARHVGTFGSAAWSVTIRCGNDGLELHVRRRGERDVRRASLQHAAGGVWFPRPAVHAFPHVELVALDCGSEYLWNGRFALRRIDGGTA